MKKNEKIKNFGVSIVRNTLKICHIKVNDKTEHLLVQIFNFGIVGVIATIIDFLFLYLFRDVCRLPLILSNTFSFCISVVYNYFASMTFVFDVDQSKSKSRNFILFIIFSVIGLIINDIIVYIVTEWFGIYYMASKVIATVFVMIFNFITRKKFLE